MDRDAARRTGRVRFLLLCRHVIAREETRRRGEVVDSDAMSAPAE